ncbi:MAG: biopolymer transporter ExbD [Bacteroidetes bacterium]|nr:MAG: biopolymer transporter ExbD [Bacteroidota bacterium]
MPSVKIPRKSTDTDMTPFVDVAFLILSFFMLATKFKPPEKVPIDPPGSVNSDQLPENDAVMISIDSAGRVFYAILSQKEPKFKVDVLKKLNTLRGLNLTPEQIKNFEKVYAIGVPFKSIGQFLSASDDQRDKFPEEGIPVLDSATNELAWWINASQAAFADKNMKLKDILIKGDGRSKYPVFEGIVSALKRNDEFKYQLVTSLEGVPSGSDLDKYNKKPNNK